jgi:hypothetical protein
MAESIIAELSTPIQAERGITPTESSLSESDKHE